MVSRVSSSKYLGVTISSDLSWSPHITNAATRHVDFWTSLQVLLSTYKQCLSIEAILTWMEQWWAVSSYKYLGFTISSDLSWSPHVTNCCNKTCRLIGLLYRCFYLHINSLLRQYKSFHLTSTVWNLMGEIESLENVQKFALQVCLKSSTPAQEMSSIRPVI